jgi:hypothetical protein
MPLYAQVQRLFAVSGPLRHCLMPISDPEYVPDVGNPPTYAAPVPLGSPETRTGASTAITCRAQEQGACRGVWVTSHNIWVNIWGQSKNSCGKQTRVLL